MKPIFHSARNQSSYAYFTVHHRLPQIFNAIFPAIDYENHIETTNVEEGLKNCALDRISVLKTEIKPFLKKSIKNLLYNAPFFLVEYYFYYHIQSLGRYDATKVDPFADIKRGSFNRKKCRFKTVENIPFSKQDLIAKIERSFIANTKDLGFYRKMDNDVTLLLDDREKVSNYIKNKKLPQVDIFCDNAGYELYNDIALALYFLNTGKTERVYLHLKQSPIFVSDATREDFNFLLNQNPILDTLIQQHKMIITSFPFCDSPIYFNEMPYDLREHLASSALCIIKGDVNYRKFVEDRHWNHSTPINSILKIGSPTLLLRIIKCEVLVSVPAKKIVLATQKDPDFLINGKWGLIQFIHH